MENELTESLQKVIGTVNYMGCSIGVAKNSFTVFGKTYNSLPEAKAAIEKSFSFIQKSIK